MISLVAAIDEDGIIGDSETDGLPWHCTVDLELFRRLTWGADVVVGRKTWEELPEPVRECRGRRFRVLSSSEVTGSPEEKVSDVDFEEMQVHPEHHAVIAGGASIYEQALDAGIVDRCFLTRLPIRIRGDIEWPGLDEKDWHFQRLQTVVGEFDDIRRKIELQEWVSDDD